jgi:phospholipase/carboxylesterase
MKPITAHLTHIVQAPRIDADGSYPALIMLHGRGADEHDLFGLAPYLDPRLLIASVRAPFPFQYGGGYAWYDVIEVGLPHPRMFAESHERLKKYLDEVVASYPIDARRVFLLGFSMGAVMSHTLALTQPDKFAGVVAHSGYVPPAKELGLEFRLDNLDGCAWFVAHGLYDPIIPVSFGHEARDLLTGASADLTYKEYPIAHQVSQHSLDDLSAWLTKYIDHQDSAPPTPPR